MNIKSNSPKNNLFGLKKLKLLVLLGFTFASVGCSIPGSVGQQTGSVGFKFQFPQSPNKFSVKTIPSSTEKIEIVVSRREDLTSQSAITKTITRADADNSLVLKEIPIGDIKVSVKALNSSGKTVAEASADATIKADTTTRLTMDLRALVNKLKLILNNYPSGGETATAEIKPNGGKPIYRLFTGNELDLDEVETGNAPVRVTVFKNDATPLATAAATINVGSSETASVNMQSLELPDLSDLGITGIPTQLLDKLKNALIQFPDNTAPELKNINVVVKGPSRPLTFSKDKPLCLNNGDSLEIKVEATDKENDPINYLWGITSPFDETVFKMRLQPERDGILARTVSLPVGNHSIGVIMTDKKSFAGPVTLYVSVQEKPCGS
jgi:hypothetical protein